jgi:hypothetical protein
VFDALFRDATVQVGIRAIDGSDNTVMFEGYVINIQYICIGVGLNMLFVNVNLLCLC